MKVSARFEENNWLVDIDGAIRITAIEIYIDGERVEKQPGAELATDAVAISIDLSGGTPTLRISTRAEQPPPTSMVIEKRRLVHISIRLPEDLLEFARSYARARSHSLSDLLRMLLIEKLEEMRKRVEKA